MLRTRRARKSSFSSLKHGGGGWLTWIWPHASAPLPGTSCPTTWPSPSLNTMPTPTISSLPAPGMLESDISPASRCQRKCSQPVAPALLVEAVDPHPLFQFDEIFIRGKCAEGPAPAQSRSAFHRLRECGETGGGREDRHPPSLSVPLSSLASPLSLPCRLWTAVPCRGGRGLFS